MTVYGPDVTEALEPYANQFDDLRFEDRDPIIDLNAINPLSQLRERWQNTSNTESEHHLSTAANTNDAAYLEAKEHGQYVPGYESQVGQGVRIPNMPTGDSEVRWGYYETDSNNDIRNGYLFGADSNGLFVAHYRAGSEEQRVYQDKWNADILDGSDDAEVNPSGKNLDISDGVICQIEYVYYGYGPVKMQFMLDGVGGEEAVIIDAHVFTFEEQTSIENTNIPIRQGIVSGGTNNDALDVYVGGRQYSVIGKRSSNARRNSHYVDEVTGIDDTKWYPAMSLRIKDGSDVGSADFRHMLAELKSVAVTNGAAGMR
jgi:hypothetical protein